MDRSVQEQKLGTDKNQISHSIHDIKPESNNN